MSTMDGLNGSDAGLEKLDMSFNLMETFHKSVYRTLRLGELNGEPAISKVIIETRDS